MTKTMTMSFLAGTAALLLIAGQSPATGNQKIACGEPVATDAVMGKLGLQELAPYDYRDSWSTATGAYYMTIGALQALGYVENMPDSASSLAGDAEWEGVTWTGKHDVNSRMEFLASPAVQDCAAWEAYAFLSQE